MIGKNNIFNIRQGAKWQGMTGTKKGFVEFKNQEYAIRAWLVLMRTYRRRYGCKTIRQIVTRFAPPNENNTEQYIAFCCRQMDIKPDSTLNFDCEYISLAAAMAMMETGVKLDIGWAYQTMKKFNIQIVKKDGDE
ncbi:MAG: hypothetical protein J6E43_06525 [Prevotella sp.]|nr:hypothetical protein [Prevotella sp.]